MNDKIIVGGCCFLIGLIAATGIYAGVHLSGFQTHIGSFIQTLVIFVIGLVGFWGVDRQIESVRKDAADDRDHSNDLAEKERDVSKKNMTAILCENIRTKDRYSQAIIGDLGYANVSLQTKWSSAKLNFNRGRLGIYYWEVHPDMLVGIDEVHIRALVGIRSKAEEISDFLEREKEDVTESHIAHLQTMLILYSCRCRDLVFALQVIPDHQDGSPIWID
ncbi:MAG: hypothetical protein V7727_13365 [Sneathiella sp.]